MWPNFYLYEYWQKSYKPKKCHAIEGYFKMKDRVVTDKYRFSAAQP